jgi:hypothetical protein
MGCTARRTAGCSAAAAQLLLVGQALLVGSSDPPHCASVGGTYRDPSGVKSTIVQSGCSPSGCAPAGCQTRLTVASPGESWSPAVGSVRGDSVSVDFGGNQLVATLQADGSLPWSNGLTWAREGPGPPPPSPGPPPPPPSSDQPVFPRRFSALVTATCSGGACDEGGWCDGGAGRMNAVYQDLDRNLSLWKDLQSGNPWGSGFVHSNVLILPNPETASDGRSKGGLARVVWKSETKNDACSIAPEGGAAPPAFWGYPTIAHVGRGSIMIGSETITCEKWSNNATMGIAPYPDNWAVWFRTAPPHDPVRLQYTRQTNPMHGFPIEGWNYQYTFTNFSTAPIPDETFALPPAWKTACKPPPPPPPPAPPPPPFQVVCECMFCGPDRPGIKHPESGICAPPRDTCNQSAGVGTKGCYAGPECHDAGRPTWSCDCDIDKQYCVPPNATLP